tara:strand:- start:222994 stop:223839 length:846 start_codon:yes stop_codon:yes gene_type:complete
MTLSVAWVRTAGESQELVIATDSRLRFGCAWDACQKIFMMPRGDCAVCFAGDTQYAYPLMNAIDSTIRSYPKSMNRQQELSVLKGHILRVMNRMLESISNLPIGQEKLDDPKAFFLFGGFCWRKKEFLLWTLHYDSKIRLFTFRPTSRWAGVDGHKKIAFVGDYIDDAKGRLVDKLRAKNSLDQGGFDMEPLEVLCDMLGDGNEYPQIGGAPQVAKIYQRCASVAFPVMWGGENEQSPHFLGRPYLPGEGVYPPVLELSTMTFRSCRPTGDGGFAFVEVGS